TEISHLPAVNLSYCLMPKAYTQNTFGRAIGLNHLLGNSRHIRNRWARRNQYLIIGVDVGEPNLIIADHVWSKAQAPNNIHKVINKRVIVIEDQNIHH